MPRISRLGSGPKGACGLVCLWDRLSSLVKGDCKIRGVNKFYRQITNGASYQKECFCIQASREGPRTHAPTLTMSGFAYLKGPNA
jgi:hypothetical protein